MNAGPPPQYLAMSALRVHGGWRNASTLTFRYVRTETFRRNLSWRGVYQISRIGPAYQQIAIIMGSQKVEKQLPVAVLEGAKRFRGFSGAYRSNEALQNVLHQIHKYAKSRFVRRMVGETDNNAPPTLLRNYRRTRCM